MRAVTVEVLTARGLIRYFVLFVIDLETRRVEIARIVHQPYEDWMKQIARNLTDAMDGFLRTTRFLIHDRDPRFSASFRGTLSPAGVETVVGARTPDEVYFGREENLRERLSEQRKTAQRVRSAANRTASCHRCEPSRAGPAVRSVARPGARRKTCSEICMMSV